MGVRFLSLLLMPGFKTNEMFSLSSVFILLLLSTVVVRFSTHTHTHTRTFPTLERLTCVPELLVAIHREDNQEVAQDVDDDSEDEEAAQSCGNPGRAVQDGVAGVWRGAVQVRPIYNHCIQSQNFSPRTPNFPDFPHRASLFTPVVGYRRLPRLSSSSSSHALLLLLLFFPQLPWAGCASLLLCLAALVSLMRPCAIHFVGTHV